MPAITPRVRPSALARLRSEHAAEDGSARLLVELADGQTVEAVLLIDGPGAGCRERCYQNRCCERFH